MSFSAALRYKTILIGGLYLVNAYHVDMEDQNKLKPNLVEMAKKRRHLHLVEKLAKGKSFTPTLSRSEINELKKYEGDPGSPGIVDSQEKVAKIFGVACRTVERWVKDGMPMTSDRKYDLIDIRAWRENRRYRNNKSNKSNALENRKDTADAFFRECKAKLAEIALKKALGELIPREVIERELVQVSLTIKHALLSLPKQVAPQLAGLEPRPIEIILSNRIKEIVNEFAIGDIFSKSLKKSRKNATTKNNSENME